MRRWFSSCRLGRGRFVSAVAVGGLAIGLVGGCVYNTPPIGHGSSFSAVATVSSTDVWAVGSYNDGLGHPHGLIEHFDGHAWSIVAAPAGTGQYFWAITALSASNIYALSTSSLLHWNGLRWGVVTDTNGYTLTAIAHSAGGALMAIGFHGPGSPVVVLTHTGSGWVPLGTATPPMPGSHRTCDVRLSISSIAMLSPSDAWVTGATVNDNATTDSSCAYVAHWNGSNWTVPAVPEGTGNRGSSIGSISARGPNDVWAVGSALDISGPDGRFLNQNGYVVRWDGTAWHKLCNSGCGPNWGAIDATGRSVWVVGASVFPDDPFTPAEMEIDRWSGNGWVKQAVQTVAPPPEDVPVDGLSDVSVHDGLVVSVGSFATNNQRLYLPLVDQRPDN